MSNTAINKCNTQAVLKLQKLSFLSFKLKRNYWIKVHFKTLQNIKKCSLINVKNQTNKYVVD